MELGISFPRDLSIYCQGSQAVPQNYKTDCDCALELVESLEFTLTSIDQTSTKEDSCFKKSACPRRMSSSLQKGAGFGMKEDGRKVSRI